MLLLAPDCHVLPSCSRLLLELRAYNIKSEYIVLAFKFLRL